MLIQVYYLCIFYSKSEAVINLKCPSVARVTLWKYNESNGCRHGMTKKLLLELKLVKESENTPNREIIDDVYSDIVEGKCIIPWCDTVLKIIKLEQA